MYTKCSDILLYIFVLRTNNSIVKVTKVVVKEFWSPKKFTYKKLLDLFVRNLTCLILYSINNINRE